MTILESTLTFYDVLASIFIVYGFKYNILNFLKCSSLASIQRILHCVRESRNCFPFGLKVH
jgi:hypothetical protein